MIIEQLESKIKALPARTQLLGATAAGSCETQAGCGFVDEHATGTGPLCAVRSNRR